MGKMIIVSITTKGYQGGFTILAPRVYTEWKDAEKEVKDTIEEFTDIPYNDIKSVEELLADAQRYDDKTVYAFKCQGGSAVNIDIKGKDYVKIRIDSISA